MPRNSENTITASMSPSAMALIGFCGTSPTRKSIPVVPAAGAAGSVAPGRASNCARSSGEIPAPGRSTLTSVTPITTAIVETTTV